MDKQKESVGQPPILIKTSIRDPWPNSDNPNMGYTIGQKDAVRGLHPNGTLGLYVKLRAANGPRLVLTGLHFLGRIGGPPYEYRKRRR